MSPGMSPPHRRQFIGFIACLALAGAVVLADQLSKQAASAGLAGRPPVDVLPFLRLVLVFNKGAAFGFLHDAGGWQHYFLSGLGSVISLLLVLWLWRSHHRNALLSWGLTLVLGGALGNLIDRVSHQHVIDFILLHHGSWQFPAFNLADGAISLGALALMLDALGWRIGPAGRD